MSSQSHSTKVLLIVLVASPLSASGQSELAETPDVDYRRARELYEQGDYRSVIRLLRPLLYPRNRLATSEMLIDAHKMLGVSYVFEKQPSKAEESFYAILAANPSFTLDPLIDPQAAVDLFEEVKQRNADRLRQIAERQRSEQEAHRADQLRRSRARRAELVIERERERRSFWINFVPFGAGQFQNGQRLKGFILLGLQAALGAASVGCALALRFTYPDSRPPEEELDRARALNVAQVATGGLFWAAALYGVIDALVYYEPTQTLFERRRERERRVSLAPSVESGAFRLSVVGSF